MEDSTSGTFGLYEDFLIPERPILSDVRVMIDPEFPTSVGNIRSEKVLDRKYFLCINSYKRDRYHRLGSSPALRKYTESIVYISGSLDTPS